MRVLSHNTFWFQGAPFLPDQPGPPDPAILKSLCQIYRELDPDVICLQEIQSPAVLDGLSELLEMEGYYSPGIAHPQYGGAILWRPGCGQRIQESAQVSIPVQRMWQIAAIQHGNRTLHVANVHLPSGRQLGTEGAKQQRVAEIESLTQAIAAPLDIIAGDFNETTDGLCSEYLHRKGYIDCAVHTNCQDTTTLFGPRIDFIWIGQHLLNHLRSFTILDQQRNLFAQDDKTHLSDHLPLLLRIG